MWQGLGKFVLKNRVILLIILAAATAVMGYYASQVKLSYEFSKAVPIDNLKYKDYMAFKSRFGDDGNLIVVGIQTDHLFELENFKAYRGLNDQLRKISDVEDVLSVPAAVTLKRDSATEKLSAVKIFDSVSSQQELDKAKTDFYNLPFYKSLLYNPETHAYLMGVRINKDTLNSPKRSRIVRDITAASAAFTAATKIETHLSGLPLIRTVVADRIRNEMKYFLFGSLLLSALILLLFFRSISNTILSLLVVGLGVVWSLGVLQLCGYKITLLTGLIAPLVVVIGIPNCIYFINKYHTSFLKGNSKEKALVEMVSKMGVVTLFCNITAAIGFAVFALTQSAILKEFGVVAGISIMLIFVISFILLPSVLSYLPSPGTSQVKYLNNRWLTAFLLKIENLVMGRKAIVVAVTLILLGFAVAGILRLKSVAFVVDDLPKTDKIYTDLKFFEQHFKGVMPLEIEIDTKRKNGILLVGADIAKIDYLQDSVIEKTDGVGRAFSIIDGIKFFYQAASQGEGDSTYQLPSQGDPLKEIHKKLRILKNDSTAGNSKSDAALVKLMGSFIDTSERYLRISANMKDVGTVVLPSVLDSISKKANLVLNDIDSIQVRDTAKLKYPVTITGSTSTFLEGSHFIINGLKESVCYAFILIAICMLYLFRSFRILLCSLIPNLIPLVITAGVMGWAGVPLKPSTVLVFSVALGIAIDITIRFLVNYKQELPHYDNDVTGTVSATIKNTGLSIVYTSLVLVAGFVIFCFSSFGGTKALGWLTSITLLTATLTNLILLPVLLLLFSKKAKQQKP